MAWFKKAADQGNEIAQCYLNAEKGNADAQCSIGDCYSNGRADNKGMVFSVVRPNYTKAVEWYTKAANNWNGKALYMLFLFDAYPKKSLELLTEAANQNYVEAQWKLGYCYNEGCLVKQNPEKAIRWFKEAIKQGRDPNGLTIVFWNWENKEKENHDALAQYNIGYWLEHVYGTDIDIQEAIKWYTKAARQGNKDAKKALDRLKSNKAKLIKYLFFDAETTGIPRNYNAPTSDSRNWPRLVQLSWIITDEECNVLSQNDFIIYPEGFTIPSDAAKLHGITTDIAKEQGKPLKEVMEKFIEDFNAAKILVGHNIAFDKKIVGAELIRLGQKDILNSKKSLCTMEAGTDFCKIRGYYGYKWPKLQELHKRLFGYEFEDAHNSMSDVTATLKCFKEMRKRGLI